MGLREEKKRELRRQIRNTALGLFGEHGVGATRVADISALVRISEATFFNYFPSKQAICEEAVADVINRAIDGSLASQTPFPDQMRDLAAALVREFTADRPLVALLRRHPEILAAGWTRLERPQSILTERIQAAQAEGTIRTTPAAEVLGNVYLDILLMALARALSRSRSDEDLASDLEEVLTVWTDGCAPRKTTRPHRASRRSPRSAPAETPVPAVGP